MGLKKMTFKNTDGNIMATSRNQLKKQGVKLLVKKLDGLEYDIIENKRGGISMPVGIDTQSGETIYIEFEVKANVTDPMKTKTKAKPKKTKVQRITL